MRHEALKSTLTLTSAAVSDEIVVDKYREKTVSVESSGTWTSTTVRLLGRIGEDGAFVPVGYVSGSGAKTLTAAGCFLVPEAVDAIKVEATAYNATSGTITARFGGFNARTD